MQGGPDNGKDGRLFFRPPKLGIPGVPLGCLVEALGGVYGDCKAPRLLYLRVVAFLKKAKWVQHSMDLAVVLFYFNDSLVAALKLHVDDLLATAAEWRFLEHVSQAFQRGKWDCADMTHTGY